MKHTVTLAALVLAAACGTPALESPPEPPAPTHDGGPDATGNETGGDGSPAPDSGAAVEGGGEAEAEAARPDAGAEAAPPAPDAGHELEAEAGPAMPDAGPTPDANAPAPEAGREAGATVCDGQAPAPPLDCTAASPACDSVRRTNEAIRAQFPAPCTCGAMKCAGVYSGGVTETIPVTCRNDAWTAAGMQSGTSWVPWFQCSAGCARGKLCDP